MNFLTSLNGTAATLLLCSLLFVDETGVPLPFAPNEGLLLVAGILVGSGTLPLAVIMPAAYLAMASGMLAGYGWSRAIGPAGLQSLAERVHATRLYERAQARLRSASPWGIALARMIPGVRPYATMVCGAAEVDIVTFVSGALPALAVWEVLWIAAGLLIGLPIEHLLGRFERLAVRGGILVALGAVSWFAIRHASPDQRAGVMRIAPRLRATLALVADAGIVATVVFGAFAVGRRFLSVTADGWIEILVAAVVLIALLIIGRTKDTPGERLFETNYWHAMTMPST
jgi:membrane protein DedA with SNARE-associated domain